MLTSRPGPSASVAMRKTAARPDISMRVNGSASLKATATTAGAISAVTTHMLSWRSHLRTGSKRSGNSCCAGSNRREMAMSRSGRMANVRPTTAAIASTIARPVRFMPTGAPLAVWTTCPWQCPSRAALQGKAACQQDTGAATTLILHPRLHGILHVLDLLDLDVLQLAADLLDPPDVDGLHDVARFRIDRDRSARALEPHAL